MERWSEGCGGASRSLPASHSLRLARRFGNGFLVDSSSRPGSLAHRPRFRVLTLGVPTRMSSFALRVLGALGLATALALPGARRAGAAATDSLARVVYQDTVVVSSTKLQSRLADLATTASVIPPDQIRLGTARSVHDVLAIVPGAHVLDLSGSESQGAVESRGFAAQGTSSHMLVLLDEIPINDLEGDRVDWNLLGQAQVDRVEFLRGPASFLYGDASMAGVVNVITRRGEPGRTTWAQGAGGSDGRANAAAGVSAAGARTQASVSGSFQRLDGERENSEWRAGSGYAFGSAELSPSWTVRGRLLGHRGEQEVPGPLPAPDWKDHPRETITPDDRRDDTSWEGSVELDRHAGHLEVTSLLSGDLRNVDAVETVIPTGTLDRRSRARSGRGEVRFHWTPPNAWVPHVLVGAEGLLGRLESRYHDPSSGGALVGAGDVDRSAGAVFALLRLQPLASLSLTGGARLDWLRSSFTDPTGNAPASGDDDRRALSPTVGLNVVLPRGGHAYLAYAGSFKAPTLEQLYDQRPYVVDFDGPGGQPPFTLHISSAAIEPQRGDHVDGGVRATLGPRVWAEGAGFYARSRDEIGFDLASFRL